MKIFAPYEGNFKIEALVYFSKRNLMIKKP